MASAVNKFIASRLLAVLISAGTASAVGTFYIIQDNTNVTPQELSQAQQDKYVQAVIEDDSTSLAVKLAMVMGWYYESSGKHIGTPYVDKLGKGQPLTVCNGITGKKVIAGKYYSERECYELEKEVYVESEKGLKRLNRNWEVTPVLTQATLIDFVHNKGIGAYSTSTMRKKVGLSDFVGACKENPKWNKGTIGGVLTVLPGLKARADSNQEICLWQLEQ